MGITGFGVRVSGLRDSRKLQGFFGVSPGFRGEGLGVSGLWGGV